MEKITSRNNPKIKYACSLKKLSVSKSEGKVLAEGVRLCEDAALNGISIEACFVTESLAGSSECEYIIGKSKYTYIIENHVAEKLSDTKNPQGVFCVCELKNSAEKIDYSGKYIFLENLRDPGNLGTVIRTAEAFGMSGVIVNGCCSAFSQKALRASMGAAFRFPVIEAENKIDFLNDALNNGMSLYAAVPDAAAEDVSVLTGKNACIVAVGNEGDGLSEELISLCKPVTIHMSGRAESLNAAQAATVLMYEITK